MQRDAFLARVREAAEAGRAYRVETDPIEDDTGRIALTDDKCEALAREFEAVGGTVHWAADDNAARASIEGLIARFEAKSALCWQHPLLDRIGLRQLLAERNVAYHHYEELAPHTTEQQRNSMLAADLGISSVDFAVAETGSLVVCSKPGQERAASLVPPVHLAIFEASQIVTDLFDVFDALGERDFHDLPSNLAFITGPSKTGDIELQLTTGVHGPGECHIMIVGRANP